MSPLVPARRNKINYDQPVLNLRNALKIIFHFVITIVLTVVTQVGGVIYLITLLVTNPNSKRKPFKRTAVFIVLYLLSTYLIIPIIAPFFGREKIKESAYLQAHSFFYKLANRNYVTAELNRSLGQIAIKFEEQNTGIMVTYLDANFPFLDGFPLLPHLSHKDGKKIDVSLIYKDSSGSLTNKKPSVSGYGVYEVPAQGEYDQNKVCKDRGYWQYDIPKYLTLGKINKDIKFSEKGTRQLVKLILNQNNVGKLFIEPHLKTRINLKDSKVRFHGCHAVRHDDHIHFQLK